jgi:SOS-response transcriptional repressor LexA
MPTDHRERLARIRRFDQLVAYLRDELGWPIDSDDFEELTFEYTPEELGIDANNAAKIQEIKRLRPLVPSQPWGIFFVKFEPKRLPVVALRRILGQVTLKKRASANESERQAWAADDLLFVSNYGEGEERRIAFAHFSNPQHSRDLPTLKVLGWDNLDTPLHLDAVARELSDHLTWPDDEDDSDAWRERWRAAFKLRHREAITTSKHLSERLAELARAIRDRTRTAIAIEAESGPLTKLMKAFQTALVHDLDEAGFADMYAQTIAYGLLSARITDPARRTTEDFAAHMRTNPFLKELMHTFLRVGGRRGTAGGPGIDFDELGASEVVELLDQVNMDAVVRDFGDRNPQEDPVIHFYEHFLAAYDKKQKVERGVFYTPRPVVSYIVRSVDRLLRKEFGLTDGLADTATWGEMANRHKELEIPEGTPPGQPFVQMLDPASGTGTFLVEVIDLIHNTMTASWKSKGHALNEVQKLWNEYVPKHLLPRLHGYELLMAPYAIAHLKIGLKLFETGYLFERDERARVYLTNALEPPGQSQLTLGFLPALAHEAEAVNEIKRKRQFTVVIGNPPYLGEAGRGGDWIAALMRGRETRSDRSISSYFEVDGGPLNERNPKWLNDLYVRFTRLSHWLIERTGLGVHGFITNHGYLDNPTFRGMRCALLTTFDQLSLVDLHGNLKKREVTPNGRKDENVFDIQQGVTIGLFTKTAKPRRSVLHADLWGERKQKYHWLLEHSSADTEWVQLKPIAPYYLFKPFDDAGTRAYYGWPAINDVMAVNVTGIFTARDDFVIDFDGQSLRGRIADLRSESLSDEAIRKKYFTGKGSNKYPPGDSQGWKLPAARRRVSEDEQWDDRYAPVLYRPFDTREMYYAPWMVERPRTEAMPHMLAGRNRALCIGRAGRVVGSSVWDVLFASTLPTDLNLFRRGGNCLFPLYLYPGVDRAGGALFGRAPKVKGGRIPNLESSFVELVADTTELRFVHDGRGTLRETFGPEDILSYIYSVFHSHGYRVRYEAQLKLDFPRVPLPMGADSFRKLVVLGRDLMVMHVMECPKLNEFITTYTGARNPEVRRVGWSDGTVWLDAGKTKAREGHHATERGTSGFHGVSQDVWDFQVGGYQVCHKWLKDRNGRRLSNQDIADYQKIVVALNETIRIMAEVDEVIETHGGWPDAFQTESHADAASEGTVKVVPFRPPTVEPAPEDRYVTCVPLVELKAAAGGFSDPQYIDDRDFEWVAVESGHRLHKGMFVAQVVGKSMEPRIPDRSWCLFRAPVEGTRQGKTVLVQLRDDTDPETDQRYTVKRYKSEKTVEGDSWLHVKITLEPVNPEFEPIVITSGDEGELQVIAELVEVLEG